MKSYAPEMDLLPTEIWTEGIFPQLEPKDYFSLRAISKYFYHLTRQTDRTTIY